MKLTDSLMHNAFVIGAIATLVPTLSFSALASPIANTQSIQRLPVQQLAGRPEDAENSSSSGGVRGECPVGKKNLKALNPVKDPGQTTQAYPTFWFYLPFGQTTYTPTDESSEVTVSLAQFELLDDRGDPVLQQPILIRLPSQAGIVNFTLPSTEKPLEVGKDYYWSFSIVCDAEQVSANPTVSGWLTRVPANSQLDRRLKATPLQQQYLAYKDNGFWFEYVTELAKYRINQPNAWSELLRLFDLQEFANAPVSELRSENTGNQGI